MTTSMITYRLTGRCQGCGETVHGSHCVFPKRINLNSIKVDHDLLFFRPCSGCDRNKPQPVRLVSARMDEESRAHVDRVRANLRVSRKKAAA